MRIVYMFDPALRSNIGHYILIKVLTSSRSKFKDVFASWTDFKSYRSCRATAAPSLSPSSPDMLCSFYVGCRLLLSKLSEVSSSRKICLHKLSANVAFLEIFNFSVFGIVFY